MSDSQKEIGNNVNVDNFLNSRVRRRMEVVGVSIVSIAFFGGIGYLIDAQFDKKPIFMAVGIAISFIATQIILYKRLKQYTQSLTKDK